MIRFETGLSTVPGAVTDSVAAPASTQTRKSSHRPNPGGTRILAVRVRGPGEHPGGHGDGHAMSK